MEAPLDLHNGKRLKCMLEKPDFTVKGISKEMLVRTQNEKGRATEKASIFFGNM